jgi:ribA/ribD-fused uncharacterized protein
MDSVAVIHKVKEEFGWMSNMSNHGIVYAGEQYRSAEALFQSLRFDEPEIQAEIRAQHNPMSAKITARSYDEWMTTTRCSDVDLDHMRMVLRLKLEQHPELLEKLLATGAAKIVEDCTNRQHGSGLFWGAARQIDDTWQGENWLGRLWMELRAELLLQRESFAQQA